MIATAWNLQIGYLTKHALALCNVAIAGVSRMGRKYDCHVRSIKPAWFAAHSVIADSASTFSGDPSTATNKCDNYIPILTYAHLCTPMNTYAH